MIESKIYTQISDFVKTNHKIKVHAHINLISLPVGAKRQLNFPLFFFYYIATAFYIVFIMFSMFLAC